MQQKKNINVFIFPIVALFTFVMLVFGAAYAYLSGIVNMNTANYQVVLPSQTSLVCTKTDCSVTVTPAMMLNTNTGSSAKTSSTCAVNCTCTGTQGAVCDYNVYMVEAGTKYVPSSSLGTNNEFTVTVTSPSGCTAQNSSGSETQVNTIRGKVVSHCALEVPAGGSKSANVTAVFKWYNLNINQDGHISKSYKYQLSTGTEVPDAYQLVEYISMSGTQHIDTGINGNNVNLRIVTTYEPSTSGQFAIFSARTSSSNGISFWTDGYTHFGNSSTQVSGVTQTGKHTVDLSKNGLYFDGTKLTFTAGSTMANSNLIIGRVLNDNRTYKGKIYEVTVYSGDTLVGHFLPCYRRLDNVIGLYDTVTGSFFTNAGSGTFTKGANV